MRVRAFVLDGLSWLWLTLALLGVWEVAARQAHSLFVPPVSQIFATFGHEWFSPDPRTLFLSDLFRNTVFPSLGRFAAGYLWAGVVGIGAGIFLGVWWPAGAFFRPLVRFGMSVPATALLTIAIAIFGIESSMNVFLIGLGSVWPVLLNTYDGVRSIDRTFVLTARSLQLTRWRFFRSVWLPGASPSIVAGLRVSLGIALVLMVASELYAASDGIGYTLVVHQRTFKMAEVWSDTFLVALIGIIANVIFSAVERRVLRWRTGARGSAEFV
jgi:ABC-type nitrate/sulfonate/bicarbonate transport system permease component